MSSEHDPTRPPRDRVVLLAVDGHQQWVRANYSEDSGKFIDVDIHPRYDYDPQCEISGDIFAWTEVPELPPFPNKEQTT